MLSVPGETAQQILYQVTQVYCHSVDKYNHTTHPYRAKSAYKIKKYLGDISFPTSFPTRKRQKAKRLHRLKRQTEGHTQSGLVHDSGHHMMFKRLFSINTPGWLDHTDCIIWPRLHDFTSPDLLLLASVPKCSLKTHGRPVFMFRVLFTHIPLIQTIVSGLTLRGQRFLSHEIQCGCRIRAPFLSCSWNKPPFMKICNHCHAMLKLKWARTLG